MPRKSAANIIGEDPNDIGKLYTKLLWAGASVGRSGVATQAIAAIDIALYDLKAKRAEPAAVQVARLLPDSVQTYNTSGGFLHLPLEQVKERASQSLAEGIGGIKIKVGQPDYRIDLDRVAAVREHLGADVPFMVDANQQWDRPTAMRVGRALEQFDLVWIEEPLDAYDAQGHAQLAAALDTSIATGEMLSSVGEHIAPDRAQVRRHHPARRAADRRHHPVPAAGRRWPIRPVCNLRRTSRWRSICISRPAYPREPWVEHFEWLNPLFNERLETRDGRMNVPNRPGLGFTLSEQARAWTTDTVEFGRSPTKSAAPSLSRRLGNA